MTPAARIQTAIECLDRIAAGEAAEKVLTGWARAARHAGSKDRAGVRDHVFDALRRWWSSAALGGGTDGRRRMIGLARAQGLDPASLFTGAGYGPAPLSPEERAESGPLAPWQAHDCPAWLEPDLRASLGSDFEAVLSAMQTRAPLFLRVNVARTDPATAAAMLARDGIGAQGHPLSPTALEVLTNPRKVHLSEAFATGLVEIQDAASQAVADALPLEGARRVLDFCAGGGGKALAIAARTGATVHAHDAAPGRMRDLPARAARAGAAITVIPSDALRAEAPYDVVLVDAPCSGSGSWRRAPEGKIRLDREGLDRLLDLQGRILVEAGAHVAPGGLLAYATCSLLEAENGGQAAAFRRRHPEYVEQNARRWTPLDGGDGFYCAIFRRAASGG